MSIEKTIEPPFQDRNRLLNNWLLWLGLCSVLVLSTRPPALQAKPLHPDHYKNCKAAAHEVVRIRITAIVVDPARLMHWDSYIVSATVLSVTRTQNGLRRGDHIRFRMFLIPAEVSICGPAYPPLVRPRWKGLVYLNLPSPAEDGDQLEGQQRVFKIAADGLSFEPGRRSQRRFTIYRPTQAQIKRSGL